MRSLFRLPQRLLKSAPRKAELSLLIQKARLAQRRKDWRSALELWRAAAGKAPDDRTAAAGYIGVLVYAGAIQEAADRADVFVRAWPADENGPILLARIAETRGDFTKAAEQWRAALRLAPGKPQALIRLGGALLADRRFDEAETCATQLETEHPAKPHGAVLRAQILQQLRGYSAAAPLWNDAARRFSGDLDFLRACGRALLATAEYDQCLAVADQLHKLDRYESIRLQGLVLEKRQAHRDRTAFWKDACAGLPGDANIVRRLLDAALWARRFEDAQAAFLRLLELNQLRASDADYVVGLGHEYLGRGDTAGARKAVRAFLRGLREHPGYRAAALRLHRLILACFPRRNGTAVQISRSTPRFLRMVRAARAGPAGEVLEKVAALEERLGKGGAIGLFDTDIGAEQGRRFVRIVREHVANGEPFSFVRLGDGEANAFQYPASLAEKFEADVAERENVWWGRTLDGVTRAELAAHVAAAAFGADALGLPAREWFLRDFRLDTGRPLSTTRSGRGLLTILHALEALLETGPRCKIFTSSHLPQDLQRWNLYPDLFNGLGEVVLISCHAGLPDIVQSRFGVRVAKHVLVPPGDSMRDMQHRALTDDEIPPRSLARALETLHDELHGKLVLAGAGYAGKVIIDEARKRGGVALDLGSIFDSWMGEHTRSYQDLA